MKILNEISLINKPSIIFTIEDALYNNMMKIIKEDNLGNKIIKFNDRYGLIDINYNVIIDCIYTKMIFNTKNTITVKLKDKVGIFNKQGKEILPLRYLIK